MKSTSLLFAAFLSCASTGLAATAYWTSGGDGISWSDGANWASGVTPAQGDDIVVSTQPTAFPTVLGFDPTPALFTVNSFTFGAGLSQGLEVWPMATEVLRIGAGGVHNQSGYRHGFLVIVEAVSNSIWNAGTLGLGVSVLRTNTYQITLESGSLSLGTNTVVDINSANSAGGIFGNVVMDGALTISLNYLPTQTTQWQLFDQASGHFTHFAIEGVFSSGSSVFQDDVWAISLAESYRFEFNENSGTLSFIVIPEPGSAALLTTALAGFLYRRRSKRGQ